jgi:hypothetical protein
MDASSLAPSVPHYQLPNFSSILPEFENAEQEYIGQAFSMANFTRISKLPNQVVTGGVSRRRGHNTESNRRSNEIASDYGKRAFGKPQVFSEFAYMPSRYSLAEELATKDRLESEARRMEVGGRDFTCAAGQKKLKYEDQFEDRGYRYPYLSDPFEAAQDQAMRAKWIDDSKILHGPFIPTGTTKPLGKPSRKLLPDIVKEIHNVVNEDWSDYSFDVLATEDDNVAVRFDLTTVDSEKGLLAYMNVLAHNNHVVQKYLLKKVIEDWDTKPGDGFLYFMFRPPWVQSRAVDSYHVLHPQDRGFSSTDGGDMMSP